MATVHVLGGYDGKVKAFVTSLAISFILIACGSSVQTVNKISYVSSSDKKPKNIILLIGDGMGLTQVSALHYKNKQKSSFSRFPVIGLQTCHSADNLITDSAASATAIASGVKTKNGTVGMDPLGVRHKTLFDLAKDKNMATGLVVSSSIIGATPAAFYASQSLRGFSEQIATDFLEVDIDLAIGGGMKYFHNRHSDDRNLIKELIQKSYIVHDYQSAKMKDPRLDSTFNYMYFTADGNPDKLSEGRKYLYDASHIAIDFLSRHASAGYMLMVEGSQIDWAGHQEDPLYLLSEIKEFDRIIDSLLDYAIDDGETLIVVTADHETGGLSLSKGNLNGKMKLDYTQNKHTGTMTPVFAYGPGSELFNGVYDNTDIFHKLKKLME